MLEASMTLNCKFPPSGIRLRQPSATTERLKILPHTFFHLIAQVCTVSATPLLINFMTLCVFITHWTPIIPFDCLLLSFFAVVVFTVFEPVAPRGPSKSLDCAHDASTQYTFIESAPIFTHSNSYSCDILWPDLKSHASKSRASAPAGGLDDLGQMILKDLPFKNKYLQFFSQTIFFSTLREKMWCEKRDRVISQCNARDTHTNSGQPNISSCV